MNLNIAISSGKGGTGKTFIATNLAAALANTDMPVTYLDCDVEAPNGHLFLKPGKTTEEDANLLAPAEVDETKCIHCSKCAENCNYNAIAVVKNKVLIFKELCHVCGACKIVCPTNAIIEKERKIGTVKHGNYKNIDIHYALLETAEGGMSPRLIPEVKKYANEGINILDSAPGTACPVVETIKDADLCVLVTDPTPFGINDLKLAVDMARRINKEPAVLVNRAEYNDAGLKNYCNEQKLEIIGEIPDIRKIAEIYSDGGLVTEKLPEYRSLFERMALKIIERAKNPKPIPALSGRQDKPENIKIEAERAPRQTELHAKKPKELVVISGKGGTGKTSLTACFAKLAKNKVISDCDVDAADLHLILNPNIMQRGAFTGGFSVKIDQEKCIQCGRCKQECRFNAIEEITQKNHKQFYIDPVACQGCGVCTLVCPNNAIISKPAINGEWFISQTRLGPMTHAKLGIAEENSGRLVTLVKNKEALVASEKNLPRAIIDGSPGTGCPVIASLTGADFAVIVTEPTVSGIHDLNRILDVTKHFGIKSGIIINKSDLNKNQILKIKGTSAKREVPVLGSIPYDNEITRAQIKKMSLLEYTESRTTQIIKNIWKRIEKIL